MPDNPLNEKKEPSLIGKIARYGFTLFLISAVCVLLINIVYSMAKPEIERQEKDKVLKGVRAVFDIVPDDPAKPTDIEKAKEESKKIKEYPAQPISPDGKQKTDFFEYDGKYACIVAPNGYDGPVKMIVGYSPKKDTVLGIYVISHTDTPGFGARIMEKKSWKSIVGMISGQKPPKKTAEEERLDRRSNGMWFQKQFYNRPASDFDAPDISRGEGGDAISGATITSRGVYGGIQQAIKLLREFSKKKN